MTPREYRACTLWLAGTFPKVSLPSAEDLERGAILGVTEIIGVVQASRSRWFVGLQALVLVPTGALKQPLN